MINLWYETGHIQGRMNGPLKVILNLNESLRECCVEYVVNQDVYPTNLLLHYDSHGQRKHELLEHQSCFIGPQFWPFDQYGKFLFDNPQYYNKIIVPSEWVKDLLSLKFGVDTNKVSTWPVGIKVSNLNKNIKYDCLVYFKRRSQQELSQVIEFLEKKKLTYNMISYGGYSESDLELLSSHSKFCFLLNGTESQGIAVQEIMASNTPMFVWDVDKWNDQGSEWSVSATSVPYWSNLCGEKFYHYSEMEDKFNQFYDKINYYNPLSFVEKNLSYKASVNKLLGILNVN